MWQLYPIDDRAQGRAGHVVENAIQDEGNLTTVRLPASATRPA